MQIQIHVNTIKDTLQMLTVKIMKHVTMFIEGGFTAVYCLIVAVIYMHHLSHHKCKKFKYKYKSKYNSRYKHKFYPTCPTQMQEIQIQFKIRVTMLIEGPVCLWFI